MDRTTSTSSTTTTSTTTSSTTTNRRTRRQRLAAGAAGLLALGAMATAIAPAASAESAGPGTTASSGTTGKGSKGTTAPRSVNKAYTVAGAGLLHIETTYTGVIRDDQGAVINEGDAVGAKGGCTAFSVSADGYLVTAGHCVDPKEGVAGLIQVAAAIEAKSGTWTVGERAATAEELAEYGAEHWTVDPEVSVRVQLSTSSGSVQGEDDDKMIGARVLDFRTFQEEDVAVLKVGADHLPVLELGTDQELREGDAVVSAGFASASEAATDGGVPTFKDGTISSKRTDGGGKMPVLETSASLNPGMSGGPTVDADGRVVGVNSGYMKSSQAFNYVRPASLIAEMLRREGVDNTLTDTDIAFRDAIDAYNDGDFSTAVTKLDAVLEVWPDEARATQLREDAVKAGGTAGSSAGTSTGAAGSTETVPGVLAAAGAAPNRSADGSNTIVLLGGFALVVLVAAGGVTAVLLSARRNGSAGGAAPTVPVMPTAPVAPMAPAPAAPVVYVPAASAVAPPVVDPYRTDELPIVPGAPVGSGV